jgi:GT2 family glycosyltransferase
MTAVSPEGARCELLHQVFRYRRPDAEDFFKPVIGEQRGAEYGFVCYFRLPVPSFLPSGWIVEVEMASGTTIEVVAPPVITDEKRIRTELLNDIRLDTSKREQLRRLHISPAISALQLARGKIAHVESSAEFGNSPVQPRVSVLVPLYGRIDLLEHQMAQFADDHDFREAELIYVLDSPELKADLLAIADPLFQLYQLPFKILVLAENSGFSTANNIAASHAHAPLLLLLNSDVIPLGAGWLAKLIEFYRGLENPGAIGPKLLYEDNSLQHAGLYFEKVLGTDLWTNEHYFKGLHSDLPAANIARRVPAVTAACLMIDARLYASTGGLSGVFIQGDYEDSDLCMRLSQAGRENWYFPGVELFHLEGQSYTSEARQMNYEYNRWLFNEIWAGMIPRANWVGSATETPSLDEPVSNIPTRMTNFETLRSEPPTLSLTKSASRGARGGRNPRPTKTGIADVVDKFGAQ